MSRSFRRTPIHGITTARSEAWDKQHWHGRFRRANAQWISRGQYDDPEPHVRDVSNPWSFAKDGKRYIGPGACRPWLAVMWSGLYRK